MVEGEDSGDGGDVRTITGDGKRRGEIYLGGKGEGSKSKGGGMFVPLLAV